MDCIYVKMLNTPYVLKNDVIVAFPYKKAEALFYYMVLRKKVTREEVCSLLWPDNDDETARKNLRDSIYKIKKALNMDIIISPQKSIIMLNPSISIKSDVEELLNENYDITYGEFLKGFSIKDNENYDNWIISNREYYKEIQRKGIYEILKRELKEENFEKAEKYANILIEIDNLDEKAYRILMKIYSHKGMLNKAIELYKRLCHVLDEELGITPEIKTKSLYEKILEIRDKGFNQNNNGIFYGRDKHIQKLRLLYENFINKGYSKAVLITGEAGIGKTRLKDEFLKSVKDDIIIQTNCYQAEESYFLKPWNFIINKIFEYIENKDIKIPEYLIKSISYMFPILNSKPQYEEKLKEDFDRFRYINFEDAVVKIIEYVAKDNRIIVVFEDIQWCDNMSLNLLLNLINKEIKNVMIIMTLREEYNKRVDRFLTLLSKYERHQFIEIKRFNKSETEDFINKALPNHNLSQDLKDRIYKETEGNTFFIVEVINSILRNQDIDLTSSKIKDLVKSRFIDISDNAMKLLSIISMFFDKAPLSIIKDISGKDDIEIADMIEELENRCIICEEINNSDVCFKFTHQKLREYIYYQQSEARRIILHRRIAQLLEKNLKGDIRDVNIYSKLIYHFKKCKEDIYALKYSIKNINVYLDFNHELFPVLIPFDDVSKISKLDVIRQIDDIEKLLQRVKDKDEEYKETKELEAIFFHIKGRYLIRQGEYEKGIDYIKDMINISNKTGNNDLILKGYKQLIYYGIQIYNTDIMGEYVEKALKIAKDNNNLYEVGSLLRLKGLYSAMIKDFYRAEELLKESINVFNILNQKQNIYSLNIAAAYNYIGEIRRMDMKFSSALEYYNKAISICENKNSKGALAVFNTNAGQAAFEMGDYERSKYYFKKAIDIYESNDSLWGRAIAEAFMCLLLIKEGNLFEAKEHIKRADKFSSKIKSPHEIGLVYRIKAEIKLNMQNNTNIYEAFCDYLTKDLKFYCDEGIKLLNLAKENYEVEILEIFKKNYINN